MYYDRFYPFYMAYANPGFYQGEQVQEKEFGLMKTYYPKTAQKIQRLVEEECDSLDYEGSMLYDEYPDKYMLYHLCGRIQKAVGPEVEAEQLPGGFLDELVQVMLCHEIHRRRCKRQRCRRYY